MDVLQVTGGQDHGARFGLRGSSATIGRGPRMDIVLSDPGIAHRHARVRVEGPRLLAEDLASTTGTLVNGTVIAGPVPLAAGDRLTLGGTELTVLWTPTGSLPAPVEPASRTVTPPPSAAPRPADPPAPAVAPRPAPRTALLLPIATLALAAFAIVALWMPAIGDASGTDSIWSVHPAGLRVQALGAALVAAVGAGFWLWGVVDPRMPVPRPALAAATAVTGGLVAGTPLLLLALDLPAVTAEAGAVVLACTGAAIAGCAVAALVTDPAGVVVRLPEPAVGAMLVAAAGSGAVLAAVACTLTWVSSPGGGATGGGLAGGLGATSWLLPLSLVVAAGCGACAALARTGPPPAALIAGTAALAAACAALATAAAITLHELRTEAGLSLATAGTGIACVATAIAATAFLRSPPCEERPPGPSPAP